MTDQTGLASLTQEQLEQAIQKVIPLNTAGRLPDYIPLLGKARADWLAVRVQHINGQVWSVGNTALTFPLMSVIKPFLLLFALERIGSQGVFGRVGMEPSDQPFHSLTQLVSDRGRPRNPMINSGAITLTACLPGIDGASRCEILRRWLNQRAGSQLQLDQAMLASVRSLGNEANRSIASLLAQSGYLEQIDIALDTYNHICCLSGTITDLVQLGLLLAQPQAPIEPQNQRIVNALMLTCGLYEASGRFAVRVGLPGKSGVSGTLLTVVPGQGAIACYSPPLDQSGNSVVALALVEYLAQSLYLSVFG